MSELCVSMEKPVWYKHHLFPLVPMFWYREGNEHNSRDFQLNWLFFRLSSMMTPYPSINAYVEGHGIGFSVRFLYLMLNVSIPFWGKWQRYEHDYIWRIGAKSKFKWMR